MLCMQGSEAENLLKINSKRRVVRIISRSGQNSVGTADFLLFIETAEFSAKVC